MAVLRLVTTSWPLLATLLSHSITRPSSSRTSPARMDTRSCRGKYLNTPRKIFKVKNSAHLERQTGENPAIEQGDIVQDEALLHPGIPRPDLADVDLNRCQHVSWLFSECPCLCSLLYLLRLLQQAAGLLAPGAHLSIQDDGGHAGVQA